MIHGEREREGGMGREKDVRKKSNEGE